MAPPKASEFDSSDEDWVDESDEAEEIARRPQSLVPGLICVLPVLVVLMYTAAGFSGDAGEASDVSLGVEELGHLLFTSHAPAVLAVAVY